MNDVQYFTRPGGLPGYTDLRPFEDDVEILRNPHKGWYFHYMDNGARCRQYRNTLKAGDDLTWLPGLDHLYLRFDWSDVEKEEGKYDWSCVDEIIDAWSKKGYRFSLRMCTFESNRPEIPYATPKWVFDAGAEGIFQKRMAPGWLHDSAEDIPFECTEPVYSDEVYLEKLSRFMEEYGRHYNGHPLVDYIDFGSFGTWGEGHTGFGSGRQYGIDTLMRHLELHLKNFPDTRILLTIDSVGHLGAVSETDAERFLETCRARGMGIRCDSLYVKYFMDTFGASMMKMPTAFDRFWKEAPVDLEWTHQKKLAAHGAYDGGLRALETMRRTHATYMGFHGDPYVWYGENRFLHDWIANRLGYWYFLEGFALTGEGEPLRRGTDAELRLLIENRGAAPAYHLYRSRVIAVDERGAETELAIYSPDNRQWMPEACSEARIPLETSRLAPGSYRLYYGLFDGERPVLFGVKAERRRADGAVLLGSFTVAEPVPAGQA